MHGPPHGPGRDRFAKLSDAVDAAPQFVHPESPFARQLEAAPHPFHSREFSPKKLAKLAESEGDDHDEEKKRLFRMIIAYFGRCAFRKVIAAFSSRLMRCLTFLPPL